MRVSESMLQLTGALLLLTRVCCTQLESYMRHPGIYGRSSSLTTGNFW